MIRRVLCGGSVYVPPSHVFFCPLLSPSSLPKFHREYRTFSSSSPAHLQLPSSKVLSPTPHNGSSESNVSRGSRYEEWCAYVLTHLPFLSSNNSSSIHPIRLSDRRGGSYDRGVDLYGDLLLTDLNPPIRLLIQCKHENKKSSSKYVRELEGTIQNITFTSHTSQSFSPSSLSHSPSSQSPPPHQKQPVIGMLMSASGFSAAAETQWRKSEIPLILMHLLPNPQHQHNNNSTSHHDVDDMTSAICRLSFNIASRQLLPQLHAVKRFVNNHERITLVLDPH